MKRTIIYLHILMLGCTHTPVFAKVTGSTRIGINIVINETVPCAFEFSTKSGVGNRGLSYVDSFDCSTDSNSKKLHERADSIAHQLEEQTHVYPSYVRVEETIE